MERGHLDDPGSRDQVANGGRGLVVGSFCHDRVVEVEPPCSRGSRRPARDQLVEARRRDQVVEATGLDQVVEAAGRDQVVDASGLDQVVEAAVSRFMAVSLVRRDLPISARE